MNDTAQPSEQRTPPEYTNPADRPDLPDSLPRLPLTTGAHWEDLRLGPRPLASLGNMSWVNHAARESLAKQRRGEDTTYIHRWWIKEPSSAKIPVIVKDAQVPANKWGRPLCRSKDEPAPVFSPEEIRFNSPGSGAEINADGEHRSGTWGAAVKRYLRTFHDRDVRPLDNWPGAKGRVK